MNCAACFEDVSSQWNCGATTEPETNNYVTVNNTEGYSVVLLPCRYYPAQIIQFNRGVHLVALTIFYFLETKKVASHPKCALIIHLNGLLRKSMDRCVYWCVIPLSCSPADF